MRARPMEVECNGSSVRRRCKDDSAADEAFRGDECGIAKVWCEMKSPLVSCEPKGSKGANLTLESLSTCSSPSAATSFPVTDLLLYRLAPACERKLKGRETIILPSIVLIHVVVESHGCPSVLVLSSLSSSSFPLALLCAT
ncbi:uncharacterized protein DS421_18g618800 [Arachis hypogaea]|nr:uncharacterized protein DS421_18g618800 [Arachis hypogaea]